MLGDEVARHGRRARSCSRRPPAELYEPPASPRVAAVRRRRQPRAGPRHGALTASHRPRRRSPCATPASGAVQVLLRPRCCVSTHRAARRGDGAAEAAVELDRVLRPRLRLPSCAWPSGEVVRVRGHGGAPRFRRGDRVAVRYVGPPTVAFADRAPAPAGGRPSAPARSSPPPSPPPGDRGRRRGPGGPGWPPGARPRAGHDVTVVERAAPSVGGLAGSFEVAGLRVDHGSHRLHPSHRPPTSSAELRGAARRRPAGAAPPRSHPRSPGGWLGFPLRTGRPAAPPAPRPGGPRGRSTPPLAPLRRPERGHLRRGACGPGWGPRCARAFYGPYARKLWGVDADRARRRAGPAAGRARRRRCAIVRAAGPRARRPGGRTFLYPRRGFGADQRGAGRGRGRGRRRRAPRRGSRRRPALAPGRTAVRRALDRTGPTLDAAQVWSTAPLAALAGLASPAAPAEAAGRGRRAAAPRRWCCSTWCVDRPRWTEFDAHYFPGPGVAGHAGCPSRKQLPRRADDPADRTVLCAEIPCTAGDDAVVVRADDDLAAGSWPTELAAAGSARAARRATVEVRRLPHVYPVYRPRLRRDLADGRGAGPTRQPALVTFGRQGLFVARQHPPRPGHGVGGRRLRYGPTAPSTPRAGAAARERLPPLRRRGLTGRATAGGAAAGAAVGLARGRSAARRARRG